MSKRSAFDDSLPPMSLGVVGGGWIRLFKHKSDSDRLRGKCIISLRFLLARILLITVRYCFLFFHRQEAQKHFGGQRRFFTVEMRITNYEQVFSRQPTAKQLKINFLSWKFNVKTFSRQIADELPRELWITLRQEFSHETSLDFTRTTQKCYQARSSMPFMKRRWHVFQLGSLLRFTEVTLFPPRTTSFCFFLLAHTWHWTMK